MSTIVGAFALGFGWRNFSPLDVGPPVQLLGVLLGHNMVLVNPTLPSVRNLRYVFVPCY